MKINKKQTVTINLESQDEIDVFYQVGNNCDLIANTMIHNLDIDKLEIRRILLELFQLIK